MHVYIFHIRSSSSYLSFTSSLCFIYLQEHRARLVAAEAARVAEEQARIEREQQLLNAKLAEESGRQSAKYVASRCIALLLISDNKPCLLST